MQSGGKLELGGNRKRSAIRNSFNPSQNSADNQFLNSERSESNQYDPQISQHPASPKLPTPKKDKKDQSEQKQPNSNRISDRNQSGMHRKMGSIHQESLDLSKHAPQKQRPRQAPRNNPSPVLEESHVRGSRVASMQPQPVEELKEESKIKELSVNMSKLSESLMDLRHNYRELQKEQKAVLQHKGSVALDSPNKKKAKMPIIVHSPEKEKQIQQFLRQKQKEKEARRKVLEQIAERDRKKIQAEIKEQEELRDQQMKQRFKEIKDLGKFEEKHKHMKQTDEQRKKIAQEVIKKYEGKEAFHKRKEAEDQEKQKQRIQKEKQLLAERKEIYKPINLEEIDQHQQWFIEKREELEKAKKEPRVGELQRIEEENEKLADLWRGKAHELAQQQRNLAKSKKKEPKQKARKIKQYHEYIREKFKPNTYQSKSQQRNHIMSYTKRSVQYVRRYRYYKGVSCGEIIDTRPIAKNSKQIRKIGLQNMEYMRKLPKDRNRSSQSYMPSSEIHLISKSHDYHEGLGSFRVDPKPIIEQYRKKKLQVQLPEKLQLDQLKMVMQQLKANDERLNQKQRVLSYQQNGRDVIQPEQKEVTREMVDNIERKLSLLSQL